MPPLPRNLCRALILAAACAAAAPAGADAAKYTPDCVKPGAASTVQHDFEDGTNQTFATAQTLLRPSVFAGEDGVIELTGEQYEVRTEKSPITYGESPLGPGVFTPSFTQPVPVPRTKLYKGMPIVSYATSIDPFDANGEKYSNADTYGTLWVDGKRVLAAAEPVRLRRSPSKRILILGFRKASVYAHLVDARGKELRRVRLREGSRSSCGVISTDIDFSGAKPGRWRLVVNRKARSRSAKGGASVQVRVAK